MQPLSASLLRRPACIPPFDSNAHRSTSRGRWRHRHRELVDPVFPHSPSGEPPPPFRSFPAGALVRLGAAGSSERSVSPARAADRRPSPRCVGRARRAGVRFPVPAAAGRWRCPRRRSGASPGRRRSPCSTRRLGARCPRPADGRAGGRAMVADRGSRAPRDAAAAPPAVASVGGVRPADVQLGAVGMAAAVCEPPGSARGLERCRERAAEAVSERPRAPVHGPARGGPAAELGTGAARPHPQPGRSRRRPRLAQLYSRAAPGGRVGSASRTAHPSTCTTSRCASTAASPRSRSSASCGWRERPATRSTGWCARRSPTSTAAGTWRSCATWTGSGNSLLAGVLGVHAGVAAVTASDGATLRADVMTDAERRRRRRLERTLSRRGLDNPHGRMQAFRGGRWVGVAKHRRSGVRWDNGGVVSRHGWRPLPIR